MRHRHGTGFRFRPVIPLPRPPLVMCAGYTPRGRDSWTAALNKNLPLLGDEARAGVKSRVIMVDLGDVPDYLLLKFQQAMAQDGNLNYSFSTEPDKYDSFLQGYAPLQPLQVLLPL